MVCQATRAADTTPDEPISGPKELFRLRNLGEDQFARLVDGTPWQTADDEFLLRVLYHLDRDFRPADVEAWSRGPFPMKQATEEPDVLRGDIFRLSGRVTRVETFRPSAELAERFELSQYYRCRLLLGETGQPAEVFCRTIPRAWQPDTPIDEPAATWGVFLKRSSNDPDEPTPVFAAARMAWHPATTLGQLGMDVGLFDDVRPDDEGENSRSSLADFRLSTRNKECFYQLLAAAGRAGPDDLLGQARRELERAGEDRSSVVPLFNDAANQHGRLVVLSGTARQVIRVRVEDEEIKRRLGLEDYYQIFLFTEDSQDEPLVFCVSRLPRGMPTGEGAQFSESITVAGFFFNTWAYRPRYSSDIPGEADKWQLAPLLIGREPVWHRPPDTSSSPILGAIAGGLFVLVLLGIWWALWQTARGDKRFHQKMLRRE